MKTPIKSIVVSAALIIIAAAYGQHQSADAELRISRLQQAIEQHAKAPRSIEQVSPAQDKLLERIVDEVIFLHRENIALRKQVENLKASN